MARLPWIGPEVLRAVDDEQRDAVEDRMLAREMERCDASTRAAPSPREDDPHLYCQRNTMTIAAAPDSPRTAASLEADDDEEERAIASMINRATHAREAQAEQEARIAELHRDRDFYRDNLRRIIGVTRTDGEALIALLEVRLRDADVQAADVCTDIEEHLDIKRTDPDEPLRERLVRVGLIVVEMLDARRRADNRSKRWQARARKAEDRVAVLEKMAEDLTIERDALTEERNGLTLQLGEAAKQIAKRKGGRK